MRSRSNPARQDAACVNGRNCSPDMADVFTSEVRSKIMALVRSSGNASTEEKLVNLFRAYGITGWRRRVCLPGSPDFVWYRQRVALFVDGCFWHGCPRHRSMPTSRVEYWSAKLARNINRDRNVAAELRARGWMVIRVWECALSQRRQRATLRRIIKALQNAGR